jgi:hypothetical protein
MDKLFSCFFIKKKKNKKTPIIVVNYPYGVFELTPVGIEISNITTSKSESNSLYGNNFIDEFVELKRSSDNLIKTRKSFSNEKLQKLQNNRRNTYPGTILKQMNSGTPRIFV